jgi:hypothetical protein
MFEPGPLCEDSLHLAGNSVFKNLESLKPWAKQIFEHLKVVGAVDGAVKDVRPKNSIVKKLTILPTLTQNFERTVGQRKLILSDS